MIQITNDFDLLPNNYKEVLSRIDEILKNKKTTTIAIEGPSGSGKTTLSNLISSMYDCNIFHMDDFFLSSDEKTKERMTELGGNVDYTRFKNEVINNITLETSFQYQPFDCKTGQLSEHVYVSPKKLNIIEGVYSLHPKFKNIYDLKIFISIDEETQLKRILERSGKFKLQRYITEWIPLENNYFTGLDILSQCDLIINTTCE